MKKTLFTLAIMLLALAAQAQFKIHSDNWVSIGSLDQAYGLQVTPNGYTYLRTRLFSPGSWAFLSSANAEYQKHWIVKDYFSQGNTHYDLFYVLGNGTACSTYHYTINPPTIRSMDESNQIDGEHALETILHLKGYYNTESHMVTPEEIEESEYINENAKEYMISDLEKRSVSLSAEILSEVFPDAVRTDPEARLCVNYNAVVTMLVEAVKQQQNEIVLLRKTLIENGLLSEE